MAEAGLLALVAPAARPVAPQVTAIPVLAAYHDLRWIFAGGRSWPWFAGLTVTMLAGRSALDVALLQLAWPRDRRAPSPGRSFASCAALTALAWLLLTPAATLAFGAAVLPFSWPLLAAFPVVFGVCAVLSHGGVIPAWWRRLPPVRAVLWMLASLVALTVAAAVITRLSAGPSLAVTALAGLVNARAWYSLAALAGCLGQHVPRSVFARLARCVPLAPITAILVLILEAGVARLMFTGTIQLPVTAARNPAGAAVGTVRSGASPAVAATGKSASAVLVVGGWGSSCCDAADGLRAGLPGITVRQFSYSGLDTRGHPLPSGPSADDLSLPVLGDRMAVQVRALHAASGRRVAIVAESEGTLGVYAMFARNPRLPVSAVVLLSPIVGPGRYPGPSGTAVSREALIELNHLVGRMSPYGPGGAKNLLSSVGEFGAQYFDAALGGAEAGTVRPVRWLAVVPLADAVTLPACGLPERTIVVPALHGGLLGDPSVFPVVRDFLASHAIPAAGDGEWHAAADLITGAATAWRMPDIRQTCPVGKRQMLGSASMRIFPDLQWWRRR